MQARRNFTLELPLYSPGEMAEHQAGHPRCNFCEQHFYSPDELFTHMRARHFGCQVCQRASGEFSYFADAASLIEHLRCGPCLCGMPCWQHKSAAQCQSEHIGVPTADLPRTWYLLMDWPECSIDSYCRQSHHLCEEPECEGAFMAYVTSMELVQHRRERHSRVMPRWQRDQARRVDVDFDVRRRPGTASGPGQGRPQQGAYPDE